MTIPAELGETANRELDRGLDGLQRDRSVHLVLASLVGPVMSALAAAALIDGEDWAGLRLLTALVSLVAIFSAVSMFLNSRQLYDTDPVKRIDAATTSGFGAAEFLSHLIELKILTYIENDGLIRRMRAIARVQVVATTTAVLLSFLLLLGNG